MKIRLITVGKLKEKYLIDAVKEYSKRIKSFCNLEIVELKDFSFSKEPNDKEVEIIVKKEGELIKKSLMNGYTIAMCIEGKMLDSIELAEKIESIKTYNSGNINIVIGGSYGISDEIKNMADYKLSFSRLTFPHQLMRVLLLEQIYRSLKINNNQSYHK